MRHSAMLLGATLITAWSAGAANAATVFVNDKSGWDAAVAGSTVAYEDFSVNNPDTGFGSQILPINGDLTSTTNAWTSTSVHRVKDGQFEVYWGTSRFDSFTWGFAAPINGFHVDLVGFDSGFKLTFDEGTGAEMISLSDNPFGIVFDQAVTSVTFSTTDAYDIANMDNLYTVSTVPIPAAAWLFLSALGGLIVAKRKQTQLA